MESTGLETWRYVHFPAQFPFWMQVVSHKNIWLFPEKLLGWVLKKIGGCSPLDHTHTKKKLRFICGITGLAGQIFVFCFGFFWIVGQN